MKKIVGIAVLLCLFSCTNRNQPKDDSLLFSVKIKPEQKYAMEIQRLSETEFKYIGGEKAMNKLRSMGIRTSNVSNRKMQTTLVLTTEKLLDRTYIPVKLEVTRSNSNNGRSDIPQGMVVNGESANGEMPVFSSVQSGKPATMDEKMILQSVQSSFSQLTLPEKKLKIGDLFTTESTLTIPMEKSHVEIAVTNTYKLTGIANGLASFDVTQNYAMNQLRMDNSFKGTGSGHGKLTYCVDKNMLSAYELNSELEINKKLENFQFVLKTKSAFAQKIEVSNN